MYKFKIEQEHSGSLFLLCTILVFWTIMVHVHQVQPQQ